MGRKCAATGCKSGYYPSDEKDKDSSMHVSFHKFPSDKDLLSKWLQAIPREFTPSKTASLCSKHFRENDFISESTDSHKWRKKTGTVLTYRRLKDNAVPSIFPNLPSYLSKPEPVQRGSSSTSSERHKRQYELMEQQTNDFMESLKIQRLSDIGDKLEECIAKD